MVFRPAALAAVVVVAALVSAASGEDTRRGARWEDPQLVEGDPKLVGSVHALSRSVFDRAAGGRAAGGDATERFAERRPRPEAAHRAGPPARASQDVTPIDGSADGRFAENRGIFSSVRKLVKKIGGHAKDAGKKLLDLVSDKSLTNAQRLALMQKAAKITRPIGPEDIEDCVACQFVWKAVELEVGNTQVTDDIYDSFQQQCIQAEKTKIFYPACEAMYDQAQDMISDYVSGAGVLEICSKAGLGCEGQQMPPRTPEKGAKDFV